MKIFKIASVAAAVIFCAAISAHFTRAYVIEVREREKTLAEIILANEAAAALEEEAKKVEESLGTTVTAITTTEATTTTAENTTVTTAQTTAVPADVTVTDVAVTTAPIVTDYKVGGLIDINNPPETTMSIISLTAEQQEFLNTYLIEHYFLDGFIFAANETNPEVRERKYAAAEMESAAVQTVNMLMQAINLSNPMQMLNADFGELLSKVADIKAGFAANYGKEEITDPALKELYEGSLSYFDQLESSLTKISAAAKNVNESENALLAAGLAAKALSETIIPEAMNVLEGSFDLVEASQPIFLENTTGHTILTRDEVSAILSNPAYVIK
ncbi:MAG: hypothetical protein LBM41_07125 [Ruminococcus sp.]|jgi:hypothetical protein|nr:hypothetical protein [Ruminococcus sp.]